MLTPDDVLKATALLDADPIEPTVIDLAARRPPVYYTIRIAHHWDGTLEFFVEDLQDDPRSRQAVAWAMEQGARVFGAPKSG